MNDRYWTRAQNLAREAAVDVIDGDAEDLSAALADLDSPALRADAEWLAELLLQEQIENPAAIGRAA